jgi:hypothetical protein
MGGVYNTINAHLYHYAGNNPVKYTDPDGRAAGDEFDTMENAAIDFAQTYNDDSIRENKEYGSSIYQTENGKYSYTLPKKSMFSWTVEPSVSPTDRTLATVHSHGSDEMSGGNKDNFSVQDIDLADTKNIPSYVVLPSGVLQKYDPGSRSEGMQDIEGGLPNMQTAHNGSKNDPVMGFFDDIRNHKEHNRNFPDQKISSFPFY